MKSEKQKLGRKKRFFEFLNFYKYVNSKKDAFYNTKWRLLIAALLVVVFFQVSTHLATSYPEKSDNLIINSQSGTSSQASQRMMNWFLTGFFLGFLAFALMIEGEFILAVKNTKQLDDKLNQAQATINSAVNIVERDVEKAVSLKTVKKLKR